MIPPVSVSRRRALLLRTTAFCVALASCAATEDAGSSADADAIAPAPPAGIVFDPAALRPGTRVGELVVDSLDVQRAVDSTYVGTARFRGRTELSGATTRHPDADQRDTEVCFEADAESAARLPRWRGDERRPWFCFSNRAEASRALGPPSDGVAAIVVVERFAIHRGLSDQVNAATLVRGERIAGVAVTFLANEGVLLSSGGKGVLIDGLFRRYEGYPAPADSTLHAMESARPPFHAVDLVLVTHRHGDHFHPAPVAAHLRANPRATLVASQQVIDSLAGRVTAGELGATRVVARTTAPGQRRRMLVNGIPLQVLGLSHGSGRRHRGLQHLGFVVEMGGRRVLHAGDSAFQEEDYRALRLDTARIDVALLPAWALTSADGRRVIERWIRPRHVVAVHLPDDDGGRYAREAREAMPGALVFSPMETRRW